MPFHRSIIAGLALLLTTICFAESKDSEILTKTIVIGTPEQPTIEGGRINVPDIRKNKNDVTNNLSDEFENDENIKSLLSNAAKDGKLAYVLQRVEQFKLPATVALIPMVESRYQTNAISSKGAKGAWQLMPNTAKEYGLKLGMRNNFTASADVALLMLGDLHQQFGNWTLAFAAYNAGSTRLKQALVDHPTAQEIEALSLPSETTYYIQRLRRLHQSMIKLSRNNLK